MSKTAIVTDTNSGMTPEMAEQLGVYVLPMSFFINGKQYFEGVDLTREQFFRMLEDENTTVSTSQPSPGELAVLWDRVLEKHDSLVYIPMSSGLSSSCQTARNLAADDYAGRVEVANNQRISVTQYQSVLNAKQLADAGFSAEQIRQNLEIEKFESSIYIMVDTLKYLKQGGRITPAAALIGSVLHIKPVLQIQGEKLDSYAKCRGVKLAKKAMTDAMHKDFDGRFRRYTEAGKMQLMYSWSDGDPAVLEEWIADIRASFPGLEIYGHPLALSICCHIGPNALAIASSKTV